MTNDARQSYHAVPRILKPSDENSGLNSHDRTKKPAKNSNAERSNPTSHESDEEFVRYYLSRHRINVNVRQVH
jgi:hypothetical protein